MRKLAFHVHTAFSYDCLSSPKSIVRFCQKNKIQSLCITDHDTIHGSSEAAKFARNYGVQAIIGAEYYTEIGDIVALFLKEDISSRGSMEVIQLVREQGGITVLPHPCHGHKLNDELLHAVDVIEVFNARCDDDENARAYELAVRFEKPMVAGADAHFKSDIADCVMTFAVDRELNSEDFLYTPRAWAATLTHPLHTRLSQITKAMKTSDPRLMVRSLRSLLFTAVHDVILSRGTEKRVNQNEWKVGKND
jgi:predicted metal-dependent phosphoesterase TrpH